MSSAKSCKTKKKNNNEESTGEEMEVRFARTDPSQLPGYSGHFSALVSALGIGRFEVDFMNVARELFGCEHITIFTQSRQLAPTVLLAANSGPSQVAPDIAKKYLAHYWRLDPVRGVESRNEPTVLVEIEDRDIDHSEYRRDCYVSAGLGRRLSILNRQEDETIQLNIYSKNRSHRLADRNPDCVSYAKVMLALAVKHRELSSTSSLAADDSDESASPVEAYRRRLRLACSGLTERETQVCLLIARGLSSLGIALELGISLNTVFTYRRRAYTRLGITSQNELMHLIFDPVC